jgi:biotin operon repressor
MTKTQLKKVMHCHRLSAGARLLWWELCQWISPELWECYPPQHALCDELGVSRASVIRWLKELQTKGFVVVKRVGKGNSYLLNPQAVDDEPPFHIAD